MAWRVFVYRERVLLVKLQQLQHLDAGCQHPPRIFLSFHFLTLSLVHGVTPFAQSTGLYSLPLTDRILDENTWALCCNGAEARPSDTDSSVARVVQSPTDASPVAKYTVALDESLPSLPAFSPCATAYSNPAASQLDSHIVYDANRVMTALVRGGCDAKLRKTVWPYLLGHYIFGESVVQRQAADAAAALQVCYSRILLH